VVTRLQSIEPGEPDVAEVATLPVTRQHGRELGRRVFAQLRAEIDQDRGAGEIRGVEIPHHDRPRRYTQFLRRGS
jgi:hypothetical protein